MSLARRCTALAIRRAMWDISRQLGAFPSLNPCRWMGDDQQRTVALRGRPALRVYFADGNLTA